MDIKLHGAQAPKSRVYILTDEAGRVLRLEGEYSLPADLTGWTLIEEGEPCDRLNLAQSHYLDGPLLTHDGLYRYKLADGQIVERSEEELEEERGGQAKRTEQEILHKIDLLKQKLQETDYQAIKFAEGWLSEEEFSPIKAYRQSLRDEINQLEAGDNIPLLLLGLSNIVQTNEEKEEPTWPSLNSVNS